MYNQYSFSLDISEDAIAHHGILGMKWGRRNGPPYPLGPGDHSSGEARAAKAAGTKLGKDSGKGSIENVKGIRKSSSSSSKPQTATSKSSGSSSSSSKKSSSDTDKKSGNLIERHKENLEQKFKDKGMSKSEAEEAAENRLRTEKTVAIVAGVTVAAIGAGVAYKYYQEGKENVDRVISSDKKFYRIQAEDKMEHYPFYATYTNHDKNEYTALYGKSLKRRAKVDQAKKGEAVHDIDIYQVALSSKKNLRIPSKANAARITGELAQDETFRDQLSKSFDDTLTFMKRPGQRDILYGGKNVLKKDPSKYTDKDKEKLYKALNLTLTRHNDYENAMQDTFYGALRKEGYDALLDINDKTYSSFHAKDPLIIFNTEAIVQDTIRQVSNKEIDDLNKVYGTERILKEIPQTTFGYLVSAITDRLPTDYTYSNASSTTKKVVKDAAKTAESTAKAATKAAESTAKATVGSIAASTSQPKESPINVAKEVANAGATVKNVASQAASTSTSSISEEPIDYNKILQSMQSSFSTYASDASAASGVDYGSDLIADLLKSNGDKLAHSDEADSIAHYGVLGQKWGVKNGPPYPLYRQDPIKYKAIKRLQKAAKTKKDVDAIVNSLSLSDKKRLGVNKNGEYLSLEEGENVMKRILLKEGDTPVAFLDVFDEGTNDKGKTDVSVALAVAGNKHGKGYGGEVAKKGSDWIDKHLDEFGMVWWTTAPDNVASQKLAEKNGWKYSDKDSNKDWKIYRKQ